MILTIFLGLRSVGVEKIYRAEHQSGLSELAQRSVAFPLHSAGYDCMLWLMENENSNSPSIPEKTSKRGQKNTNRGRVDIIRQTAHRGGKAVTIVKNFSGIGLPEKEDLAKQMRKACGVGGTVKDGCIEIQGDKRDEVKRILTAAGFNPVFAGG